MIARILFPLLLVTSSFAGDRIVLCGADEVFQIDPAATPPVKLWSWRAKERPELPDALKSAFATTDDCKPIDGGKRLLVSSSSGGCALLELPSGKALWWARVKNAHSIEALPDGLIAVASSTGAGGNKVLLFDSKVVEKPVAEIPLPSGHGVVWDESRKCLWALGLEELLRCEVVTKEGEAPALEVKARHAIPSKDGHDLRAVPNFADLIFSTHEHVWRFDRDKAEFRPDPDLKDRLDVKCIDFRSGDGRVLVLGASGENWWTDTVGFLRPEGTLKLEGEKLYKGRWLVGE